MLKILNMKKVYKYGINDLKNESKTKCYETWRSMLKRCYDTTCREKFHTYNNINVCSEWLLYSNFKQWFQQNYIEGYHLDKDLFSNSEYKEYSPHTCCFLPMEINKMLETYNKSRYNNLPTGVSYLSNHNLYRVKLNKKIIGQFKTLNEALCCYKKKKEEHIKTIATKYYQEGKINSIIYNKLLKYQITTQEINEVIIKKEATYDNKNRKVVYMLDKHTNQQIKKFDSIGQAARYISSSPSANKSITQCCKGIIKSYKGYKWSYMTD